jgi:MFS transporter, MHS family, proline/betaine transporter
MHFFSLSLIKKAEVSMGYFSSLTKQQKEATLLLQSGTFLEYFDLMLYVHMAVFLNELFFPKTDGFTASLLAAFAFCSSFVFRPFGALLFGTIGDRIGRKHTVVVTSFLMSISCITMTFVPTYEAIGIAAAWIITLCRVLQGISSLGEIIGARVYLTETIPLPARYPVVAWLTVSASFGAMGALAIAALVTTFSYDWRPVFFFGAAIAVIGSVARTRLRETPEFLKNRTKLKNTNIKKLNPKTVLAIFFIFSSGPVWFYFVYIYCAHILKDIFGYTAQEVIQHNLIVSILFLVPAVIYAQLSYRIYPLKLLKFFLRTLAIFVVLCPCLMNHVSTPMQLMAIQIFVSTFELGEFPASAIFYRHFPVPKRMTFLSLGYAFARALMYIITSFGLIYLTEWMGHWGLWVIMIPSIITYTWALKHFEKLDAPYRYVVHTNKVEDEPEPVSFSEAA